jgi:hypothetical protein
VGAGAATTYTTTVTAVDGFTGSVSLSVSGLPSGATASFNPTSITGSGTSTLTVSTTTATALGTYSVTITGTSGSLVHNTGVTMVVSTIGPSLTQGLLGYWNFDENAGTIAHDTSGNGYDGTISGAAWIAGRTNSALEFNGSTSYVVTPKIPFANAFSISVWVNPTATNQSGYARIAETQYNTGFYLGTNASGTKYKFIVNAGSGSTGSCGAGYGCVEGGTIASGWHLVTGTFDGAHATLYVDNAVVATDTFTAPVNTSLPLYMGRYYGGNGYAWYGQLDDIRLYNRALIAAEVSSIFSYTGP